MKLTEKFIKSAAAAIIILSTVVLTGCPKIIDPEDAPGTGGTTASGFTGTRSEALDFIFSTESVAETEITISKSSWQELLEGYEDNNYSQANFKFSKTVNGVTYTQEISNIGIRFRGNTSRLNPVSPIEGKYFQRHFALDFDKFTPVTEPEKKLFESAKGYDLRCFKNDGNFCREILANNFARECGVWTAPRAGFTHLTIKVVDGKNVRTLNFGIYSMLEEVGKQFLKERTETENGGTLNGNGGYLLKGYRGANLTKDSAKSENISVDLETPYRLKTNKTDISTAQTLLIDFANVLESGDSTQIGANISEDLTIRALACDVISGGWDNYWNNDGNNCYFYFDEVSTNGINKFYYIPYDQDNTFGSSWTINPATENISTWTNNPLAKALLKKEENVKLFKKYLNEFSGSSGLNADRAKTIITKWQKMIEPYILSDDIDFNMSGETKDPKSYTYNKFVDETAPGSKFNNIKLLSDDESTNYFKLKRKAIENYIGEITEPTPVPEPDPTSYTLPPIYVMGDNQYWNVRFSKSIFQIPDDYIGEFYIRGEMTGWQIDENWKLTYEENTKEYNLPTINIENLAEGIKYKIYDKTTDKWYGYNNLTLPVRDFYKANDSEHNFITYLDRTIYN